MRLFLRCLAILCGALLLRAELPFWAQETVASSPLEAALYRVMGLPDGTVMHLRPAWESRSHLGQLIEKTPQDADLYSLRAREEERLADFAAAEADWKHAAEESRDKLGSLEELADFYRRRVKPEEEVTTLLQLGGLPAQAGQRFQAAAQQRQWLAFTQAVQVCDEALLPAVRREQVYNAWIDRYPKEAAPYEAYLEFLPSIKKGSGFSGTNSGKMFTQVRAVAARLKASFPGDVALTVDTDADLARLSGGPAAALAVYSREFSPLWPDTMRSKYFQQLSSAHQLRAFLGEAEAAATADPASVAPVLRLFFYYEQQGRKDVADQKLLALWGAKAARGVAWTPRELKTVAALWLRVNDFDEAARANYTLYAMTSAAARDRELALAALVSMLLDVPEQTLDFGNRDLSLYRNIARMDRHPGFLNGILSLALNNTSPDFQYQNASQTAVAYFHRAAASRFLDHLKQQFPGAPETPALEAKLFYGYATYGQEDAILRLIPAWMDRNRKAADYVYCALLLADAYEWKRNAAAELAIYDRLLSELAEKSDHMPIGQGGVIGENAAVNSSRSPDYSRVLDRYISRLVQLNRKTEALALFRREIDHNPDDPGIYERLALFLEQNRLDSDLEATYRAALSHFKDMSWASKLGRFYVREREDGAYEQLTHQIADTFKGSELALFLQSAGASSPRLFLQVNLYAHKRFPYNLAFVRNLLGAYRALPTRDEAAYERLLRENWFYESDLRTRYFELLSSKGQLRSELAALPDVERSVKDSNLAALELRAGGEAWLTQYEAAAPVFVRLASLTPGDVVSNAQAISIERSLGGLEKGAFEAAVRLAEQDVNCQPGDLAAVTRVGEIYADKERYGEARRWWDRVAAVHPGAAAGYLDAASVFWDYFQFNDALRVISDSRRRLDRPALFGYEAGAIYENEGNYKEAVNSYVAAVLREGSEQAKARLLSLARRDRTGALVEDETARLTNGGFNSEAFQLRLALLEKLDRRSDIERMLSSLAPKASKNNEVEEISEAANRLGFDEIAAGCLRRIVEMSADPVEKMQARIELARFYETHNNAAEAERGFSSLLKDEPNRLGVIRAAVDFYWRQKQRQAAVTALEAAAERSQAPFEYQLRREAAEKAANSGQYDEARRLLDMLLAKDAFNGDLLAEKASTYARQNDTQGLVGFYGSELKAFEGADLPAGDKIARIAALRRGYILALTTAGQFRDGLEQYQLVQNAYPEDGGLTAEMARYADAHQLAPAVTGYYTKAVADSPHDYRWPLVLAHLQTALRHYPEAVAAFDKAVYVRPDRSDLFLAKADLETRLLRFEDAIKSYGRLYELNFHDTAYLVEQAELYARLGNRAQAMELLRAGYIAPRPREAGGYVNAMERLAEWHWYGEEVGMFGELRPLLATNSPWKENALTLEVRALVALHRPVEALALVQELAPARQEAAGFAMPVGQAVATYLEPQERAGLARQIETPHTLPDEMSLQAFAGAAGFHELEASELIRQAARSDSYTWWSSLNQLQSSRLLFEALGQELEEIGKGKSIDRDQEGILRAAFTAYEKAGDVASETRLSEYAGSEFARFFVLADGDLNEHVVTLARRNRERANEVVQYVITNWQANAAVPVIAARGRLLTPLWTNSYTALTALYSLSGADWGARAFAAVLGPRTVGGELGSLASKQVLREGNWFYYAARCGEYLGYLKKSDAESYLPAPIEAKPAGSNSYVELADSLRELKQPERAGQLYREALQLSPGRADVHDRLALLALAGQRRAEAIAEWRRAFEVLAARVEKGPLAADYWPTARDVLAHVNRAGAMEELKPAADAMLRTYARRNGAYQFEPFLAGIFDHPADRRAALAWVIELARVPGAEGIVSMVVDSSGWIDAADKDPLYRALIERARKSAEAAAGTAAVEARGETNREIVRYASYLATQGRAADEWTELQEIQPATEIPAEPLLTAGALTGHLESLISGFEAKPESAPRGEQVLAAAATLQEAHADLAVRLKEFEYGRELAAGNSLAAAWFGMAEVRFDQHRNEEALELIRSVTLTVGAPFENLPEAVHVLERRGLKSEAAQYALEWETAEPWNDEAQLAFARLKGDGKLLDAVRRRATAPYKVRVDAALLMRGLGAAVGGSDELSLLTQRLISPAQAEQPFYVAARLSAAGESGDPRARTKLYWEAIALDPSLREPRLGLAEAAFKTNGDALGLAAFESYQTASYQAPYGAANAREEQMPAGFASAERLAAEAEERREDWGAALNFYRDLAKRVSDAGERASVVKARNVVNEKRKLSLANLSRRPVVSNEVGQPGIVKPKLASLPADLVVADDGAVPGVEE